jgi:hypothetical protein
MVFAGSSSALNAPAEMTAASPLPSIRFSQSTHCSIFPAVMVSGCLVKIVSFARIEIDVNHGKPLGPRAQRIAEPRVPKSSNLDLDLFLNDEFHGIAEDVGSGLRTFPRRLEPLFQRLECGDEHGIGQPSYVLAVADSGFYTFPDQPLLQLHELCRAFHRGQRLD